jgi:hypothetical protein
MKKILVYSTWLLLAVLMVINVKFYVSSISLSEEVNRFESEIKKLRTENTILETKLYKVDSLQYAYAKSKELDFTKKSNPLNFDTKVAYNH